MEQILKFITDHEKDYIQRLRENVEIASVSGQSHSVGKSCSLFPGWPTHRPECIRQMEHAKKDLEKLGVTVEVVDIGEQTCNDGSKLPLPPILLGQLGQERRQHFLQNSVRLRGLLKHQLSNFIKFLQTISYSGKTSITSYTQDPKKKTLLVYGHLDVQPALVEDGWSTDPFKLVEKDGKLWGRGSTDDKGPVLGWINAIEAYQSVGADIPINIKFCLEGMEESGSVMLEETVRSRTDFFATNVDWVCISDNYFLGKTKPCLTYGLRGCAYFGVEVRGAHQDLHSGVFGGSVPEAMIEISNIFASLIDAKTGKILIEGLSDQVDAVTEEEKATYKDIDFSLANYQDEVGCGRLLSDDKTDLLMRRWRFPSLSIHGIHG